MANYYGTVRTNYFRVTDEAAYRRLFSGLSSDDEIQDFTKMDEKGELLHGFGSYSSVNYFPPSEGTWVDIDDEDDEDRDEDFKEEEEYYRDEDCDPDFDLFLSEMQRIIHPDDAFVLMEIGNEKLRYLVGSAIVVTQKGIESIDLESEAMKKARTLLGNPKYDTRCQY